jgi:hypothetical protein
MDYPETLIDMGRKFKEIKRLREEKIIKKYKSIRKFNSLLE